jgi:hypothetical protein
MVLIAGISVPASAYANAGTPLMWVSALHLVFGNFLLGILEGALLVWWFRSRLSVALPSMIAANYFSAWLGGYILFWQLGYVGEITLLNFWFWFWSFWIAAFVLTCGLEFPFFIIAVWKRGKGFALWRTIAACLLVHSVSYLILSWLYFGASKLTIATKFTLAPVREVCPENQYTLFYMTPDGRHVVESTLLGASSRPVFSIPPAWNPDRLAARLNEDGRYDLYLVVEGEKTRSEIIREDFACQAPLDYVVGLGQGTMTSSTQS